MCVQKNLAMSYFFVYFLSIFGKNSLTHLTANVMFSKQRFAILTVFLWRGCMIVFGWRGCVTFLLRDCVIFVWRGSMIFVYGEVVWFVSLTHSLRLPDLFLWRFFCGEVLWYFCWEIAWSILWRGWMIFVCEEVAWFFVWKGFLVKKKLFGENNFFRGKKYFWDRLHDLFF